MPNGVRICVAAPWQCAKGRTAGTTTCCCTISTRRSRWTVLIDVAASSAQIFVEKRRAAIAAVGHQGEARDRADLGPAQPVVEPPCRAGLVGVEHEQVAS